MFSDNQLSNIQQILEEGNPDVLQKLYRETDGSTLVTQQDIMKIWYGMTPLSKCSDAVLNLLSEILLSETSEFPTEIIDDRKAFADDPSVPALTKQRCQSMFEIFRPYEAKLQQDFALMSKHDAVDMLESIGVYNVGYMRANLMYLNQYCRWRVQTGRPTNDIWHNGQAITVQDIDFTKAMQDKCYSDPLMLSVKLESSCVLYDGYAAPVIASLIWMGFSRDEMVKIKNSDVDLERHTICGVRMPYALEGIIIRYLGMQEVDRPVGKGMRRMYLEDIGYLLKRVVIAPNGKPITTGYISTALSMNNLVYKDIQNSSRYFQMWQIETEAKRKITQADVMAIWQMKFEKRRPTIGCADRMIEYQFWLRAFSNRLPRNTP